MKKPYAYLGFEPRPVTKSEIDSLPLPIKVGDSAGTPWYIAGCSISDKTMAAIEALSNNNGTDSQKANDA